MEMTLKELTEKLNLKSTSSVRPYLCRGEFTNHIFIHRGKIEGLLTEDIERLRELVKPRILWRVNESDL